MEHEVVITLELCHAGMVGPAPSVLRTDNITIGVLQTHHLTHILPGTSGLFAHRVGDMFGNASGSIHQIVLSVALIKEGALLVEILIIDRLRIGFQHFGTSE